MSETVIIAPHPDDEIIGCYDILSNEFHNPIIVYTSEIAKERQEETRKLREVFPNIKIQMYCYNIPPNLLNNSNTFYFPHPTYELHPDHRMQGSIGENLARQGIDVIFYSTNMNAPFIHEVTTPNEKLRILNEIYPSQSDLWKYDHKYFLFEGRCKWLF